MAGWLEASLWLTTISPPPELCALLLLLLGLAALTRPSPLHPICDTRVMEKFIKEARDTENAVEGCTNSCNLSEVLTVPDTKVNFNEWKKMDVSLNGRQTQAAEVWRGQALLSAAVLRARDLVPDPSLNQQLGRGNDFVSLSSLLREGEDGAGACPLRGRQLPPDPRAGTASEPGLLASLPGSGRGAGAGGSEEGAGNQDAWVLSHGMTHCIDTGMVSVSIPPHTHRIKAKNLGQR
uniref:Erythropoietin n=1 Tax=Chrysemys picta bellii TaxID=8478 RepID=A0A8C3HBE5_CHRPI